MTKTKEVVIRQGDRIFVFKWNPYCYGDRVIYERTESMGIDDRVKFKAMVACVKSYPNAEVIGGDYDGIQEI